MGDDVIRCAWAGTDPLYRRYHDREWGVPVHNDRRLFEFLVLEGAQAGLSCAARVEEDELILAYPGEAPTPAP